MAAIFTLGHSTRDLAAFSRLLQVHQIQLLMDVRAFPVSRRNPQFNREALEAWLPEIGSEYLWEKDLGGKRGPQMSLAESPHLALKEEAFRNYADYMLSASFQSAVARLVLRAGEKRTAIMCAEQSYRNCHRMLVSDYLVAEGNAVFHIVDETAPEPHLLTQDARLINGRLVYRGDYLL